MGEERGRWRWRGKRERVDAEVEEQLIKRLAVAEAEGNISQLLIQVNQSKLPVDGS